MLIFNNWQGAAQTFNMDKNRLTCVPSVIYPHRRLIVAFYPLSKHVHWYVQVFMKEERQKRPLVNFPVWNNKGLESCVAENPPPQYSEIMAVVDLNQSMCFPFQVCIRTTKVLTFCV